MLFCCIPYLSILCPFTILLLSTHFHSLFDCYNHLHLTDGVFIQHRLFRESCLEIDRNYLKDLNVLGRDLSKTVLVDNSPHAFGYQVDNGIPIESWFDCPEDRELLKLERFLRTIQNVDDVRPPVRQKFQSYRLIEESPSIYG
jgi:TFIIF-interacting CTD phosphatase-like protein